MNVKRDPQFTVLFVGMGKRMKHFETARKMGFPIKGATTRRQAQRYPFAKYYPHDLMPKFYNSGDVLVITSISEGCPRPCFEAGACELPVIVSDTSGAALEMLSPWQIAGRYNDVEAFRSKVQQLKDNSDLRLRLGKENRRKVVEGWDWEVVVKQYENFFLSVIR